jgi:colanic acid biosynthesis glycosyl transferase WcaI
VHVLIITPYYAPDLGPSAPLFTMLSKGLVQNGHQVTVITMLPNYPSGHTTASSNGKWFQRSMENSVHVVRVSIPSVDRDKLVQRMLQFICFQIGATLASLSQNYDVAIITNPALETWLPFTWQVVFRHMPIIFSVLDVYPDVGIKLGIFRSKPVIKVVTTLERFCLKHSAIIQIISDSFRPGLNELGAMDSKMVLVNVWVDTELIRPLPHDNSFAQKYDLVNRFVVLYAGNIGLSQGLENILRVAELLSNQKDLRFVFVGDGTGREILQAQAKQQQLLNVQFIPFQPRERLPEVLATADISLVILKHGIGTDSLPSKTFSIMASGRPIIVSVEADSEISKLIKKADAGVWVPPEQPSKLAEAILTLKQDNALRDRIGHNGRIWAEQRHSLQIATEQFEKLLLDAIASKK